jgi:hypothetical protein
MWRNVAAVVFGYVVIAVLIHVTDSAFQAAIPGFRAMSMKPKNYFVISLATDTLYCVAGGWICSLIAKAKTQYPALALILLAELIAFVSAKTLWTVVPHYFSVAPLILTPLAIWIGSRLGRRTMPIATARV